MAYYDALIAKWAQAPAGTTEQKLAWINAETVVGDAIPMIVPYYELYNRISRTEYDSLAATKQQSVQRILNVNPIDFGKTAEARRQMLALFPLGTVTQTTLKPYTDLYDVPKIPWPTAPLEKGGGGLRAMVAESDLKAAGII